MGSPAPVSSKYSRTPSDVTKANGWVPRLGLLTDHENGKRIRNNLATSWPSTGLRWRSGRTKLRADQNDGASLGIERRSSGPHHRLQGLLHGKAGRAIFFDNRQRAVALRAERLAGLGIE